MPSRTLRPHGVKVLVRSVSMPILIVSGSSAAGSVGASVAGASVTGASVAGASVAGASVAGASVAGAAVSAGVGAPHAVAIIATTRRMGIILKVISFFFFILPPISKIKVIGYK